MIIREFQRSDQRAVRSIVLRGLAEHFGFVDESLNPDLDDVAAAYTDQSHVFLVAEEGDEIVGTVGLLIEGDGTGQMMRLSVPSERRRQGIASNLVSELLSLATKHRLREIIAGTKADWSDANCFYEATGFTVVRRTSTGIRYRRLLDPIATTQRRGTNHGNVSTSRRLELNSTYYARFAAEVGDRTDARNYSRAMGLFTACIQTGTTVLDIGCGSGQHMLHFREQGYEVVGIDPSERMRELASSKGLDVRDGSFETLRDLALPQVRGVWCAASLLHVPEADLPAALAAIRERLPVGGPLFVTVRKGVGASWDAWDDPSGDSRRFIQLYSVPQLSAALAAASFRETEVWSEMSTWGRPSEWISIVAGAA